MDAVQVFTYVNQNDNNCVKSGIYAKSHKQEIKIQKMNLDFCSVFRCEFIATDEGLNFFFLTYEENLVSY